ncbi:MAG: nucleotidyltransferase domain-containing protein [Myxococcales bacterium]
MRRQELLAAIKAKLNEVYGARLKGLVLFGSFARGRARPDSDIDILALLDGPLDYGHELQAIVDALYDLQLLTAHPLEVLPADSNEYAKREWPLYRAAAADGKAL